MASERACPDCNGSGKKIKVRCNKCNGQGYEKVKEYLNSLDVNIVKEDKDNECCKFA